MKRATVLLAVLFLALLAAIPLTLPMRDAPGTEPISPGRPFRLADGQGAAYGNDRFVFRLLAVPKFPDGQGNPPFAQLAVVPGDGAAEETYLHFGLPRGGGAPSVRTFSPSGSASSTREKKTYEIAFLGFDFPYATFVMNETKIQDAAGSGGTLSVTPEDLAQGWYWGETRREGTPEGWTLELEGTRGARWAAPEKN